MFPRLVHFSVTFTHFDKSGTMDGFRAYDTYSFTEKQATKRCIKRFKKEYKKYVGKYYSVYLPYWTIDCEVI